ncbi:MAG: hypothetical protein IJ766_01710 [Clostridia bacterium]|nr:hypothetical protein [Clostridia bacterium]
MKLSLRDSEIEASGFSEIKFAVQLGEAEFSLRSKFSCVKRNFARRQANLAAARQKQTEKLPY